ncbi:MAG: hypothetical protein PVH64_08740 [Bacillota bacterium]
MRNFLFGCLLALLMVFSGCTNISEITISKLDIKLNDGAGNEAHSLVPGWEYQVKLEVYDADYKFIKYPDYRQIEFNSPNLSLLKNKISKIYLKASRDTWGLLYKGEYEAVFAVKDNSFPTQVRKWPIAWKWNQLNTLSYQGHSGSVGLDGINGSDGRNGKPGDDGYHGGHGFDGGDGGHGRNGGNPNLIVAYYDLSGLATNTTNETKLLLFYNMDDHTIFLSKVQPFYLNSSGGDGGKGGAGGDGGEGGAGGVVKHDHAKDDQRDKDDKHGKDDKGDKGGKRGKVGKRDRDGKGGRHGKRGGNGGNGGDGGDGGRGGDGGDAGNITVWYYDESVLDYLHPVMNGGRGGRGGKGGSGGPGGAGRAGGRDGRRGMRGNFYRDDGIDGRDGRYITVPKSFDEIAEMLEKGTPIENFDSRRLVRRR